MSTASHSDSDSTVLESNGQCPECEAATKRDEEHAETVCEGCGLVTDTHADRSAASASPFSRGDGIRGREWDEGAAEGRPLERPDAPKRGTVSGRRLGCQIAKKDCDGPRWERLRKRDEGLLEYDADRHDDEGGSYINATQRGAGVETNGDDRIRSMTLLTVVETVADRMNADEATQTRARSIVTALDETETNGRSLEATVEAALVVARDEFVATRVTEAADEDVAAALERASGPVERSRVLDNVPAVTDDETLDRILEQRLVAEVEDEDRLATTLEAVGWGAL